MKNFEYIRPTTLEEAQSAALDQNAVFLAGGTNLVDLMKVGVARPDRVIDITGLPDMDRVDYLADGSIRIGALVRNTDLACHPQFSRDCPAVAEAILSGASGQLRNAATAGGNILQRTRCAYLFDLASPCNKRDPGAGCGARHGENRSMAVLGWSESCIATHPSDFSVPMAALDAVVEIVGPAGRREVAMVSFHTLPGGSPERETVLAQGELVVALRLPPSAKTFAQHTRYLKLRDRTSFAFGVVSAAAGLVLKDGVITDARLALGGVALKPWRARDAEAALFGQPAGEALFRSAADIALAEARPSGHNAYKIELSRRLILRTFMAAQTGGDQQPALPGSVFSTQPRVFADG